MFFDPDKKHIENIDEDKHSFFDAESDDDSKPSLENVIMV